MYRLYPYFTNDGSVGLFSKTEDDIYHSTYGALTESWQKFILPSRLEQYLYEHKQVKILDICYGIGYNTKTALNVFITTALNVEKFLENSDNSFYDIAAIDTDNIYDTCHDINLMSQEENLIQKQRIDKNSVCKSMLIDAVDIDDTLMMLAPFIAEPRMFNFSNEDVDECDDIFPCENKFKFQQVKNIRKFKRIIKNEFKLKKEVSIILLKKMFEANPEFFNDKNLQSILTDKKYTPFLSRFMVNFAKFYQNSEYDLPQIGQKLTFLHNIYYRYISKSYKNAKKMLRDNEIKLNLYNEDARKFIITTKNTYNFIFLDAFTPAKCPTLWTVDFFRELFDKLEPDGMVLTYSSSAAVRNAFLQNGFAVGKIYDEDLKKFVGTIAAKNKSLIDYELDDKDLDLINSKAGTCFEDENLNSDKTKIIEKRISEVKESNLASSSQVLKGYK
ncbi:MAG: MnmC family methyltransferase [Candidatus Gastranaerophilales bacterium]|nr:MnmC family methyltransferase [Candidatus Gastranaerophilales bacterium]